MFESRRSERVYVNGKRFGFQPEDEGSIPSTRKRNVAQLVEHWSPKPGAAGSSPAISGVCSSIG